MAVLEYPRHAVAADVRVDVKVEAGEVFGGGGSGAFFQAG